MNVYEKILNVQLELKAPKSQYNEFGGFSYRKCEDILEALKPLLLKYKLFQKINDDLIHIEGRFYLRAEVVVFNCEKPDEIVTSYGFAREPEHKTKSDDAQITGASSSYARKYALNGMYNIDDTKDPDSQDNSSNTTEDPKQTNPEKSNPLIESIIKINKIKFSSPTEAKMWRTDMGFAENLKKASDYELSKILLKLKEYVPKSGGGS